MPKQNAASPKAKQIKSVQKPVKKQSNPEPTPIPSSNRLIALLCVLLIIAITALTYFNRYSPTPPLPTGQAEQTDYQKILKSYEIDQKTSQQYLKTVVSEEEVRAQVTDMLEVNQKVVVPTETKQPMKKIVTGAGEEALTQLSSSLSEFYTQHKGILSDPYNAQSVDLGITQSELSQNINKLYSIAPTKETAALLKDLIIWQENLSDSLQAIVGKKAQGTYDWPRAYHDLIAYNELSIRLDSDVKKASSLLTQNQTNSDFALIKTAHAFPVVIVGNVVEEVKEAIKQSLSVAFAKFATQFLDKLVATIEKNYRIANFLYYSDALVAGQYTEDYLKKYINSPLDRTLIKKFIPQISCGKTDPKLQEVFRAKAREYLGYDPKNLNLDDPDFLSKLSRFGDTFSTAQGWEEYYKSVAAVAQSEAEKNVNRELTSSGLKTPRDIVNKQINATISAIENSEAAALLSSINLGVIHVDSIVGQLVSGILANLFNKFLFNGSVVIQEQNTCIVGVHDASIVPSGPQEDNSSHESGEHEPTQRRGDE